MISSQVKSYFLVPNMNIPAPPESPLALGHVIDKKLEPLRPLNKCDLIKIQPDNIYEDRKENWSHQEENWTSGTRSVWAQFIHGLGSWFSPFGGASGTSYDSTVIGNIECQTLETTFFEPDDDYIQESLWAPSVDNFLEASQYRKPIYMITGLKVARGVCARSTESRGAERHSSADAAPVIAVGAPRIFGGEIGGSSRQMTADRFEGSTDIVIAYRLRKITCGKNMEMEHEEETSGALLGAVDQAHEKRRPYKLSIIGRVDAVADDLDAMEMVLALDDVDETECQCFLISK